MVFVWRLSGCQSGSGPRHAGLAFVRQPHPRGGKAVFGADPGIGQQAGIDIAGGDAVFMFGPVEPALFTGMVLDAASVGWRAV